MMHHKNGWLTIEAGGDIIPTPVGPSIPTQVVTDPNHEWCALYFPIPGGRYELEYQDCAVLYTDSHFQGNHVVVTRGRYDWGTIPNDQISSLRVAAGMKVTLYEATHFQGRSKTFTGDAEYVGDDFNDITSSVIVE